MPYFVYILKTSAGTLYTGQTNNLVKRLEEHKSNTKKASKYMRSFKSFELVYSEKYDTRSEAMKREYEIKSWERSKKDRLIVSQKNNI